MVNPQYAPTYDPPAVGDDAGPDQMLVRIDPRLPDVDAPFGYPDPSPSDEESGEPGG